MASVEMSRKDFIEHLYQADVETEDEGTVRFAYSGRGMYGKSCPGFVGRDTNYAKFLIEVNENNEEGGDLARRLADLLCTDSMGYDKIFYFPGLVLTGDDEAA